MKTYIINGDGYNMTVAADEDGGRIESDLRGDDFDPDAEPRMDAEFDAVESLVLAHACAGIDVTDPKYIEGLNTTLNAIVR